MAKAKQETSLVMNDATGVITSFDAKEYVDQGYAFARDFKFPEDGIGLRGKFNGHGGIISVTDPKTGVVNELDTWRITDPSGAIEWRVLGGKGLDRQLRPIAPGSLVVIKYLGKKDIGKGHMMHDYAVGVKA